MHLKPTIDEVYNDEKNPTTRQNELYISYVCTFMARTMERRAEIDCIWIKRPFVVGNVGADQK